MPNLPLAIISFSGIDGAGKSTQIETLASWLRQSGLQVCTFSMWDDIVVGARWREFASHRAFGGDQGVGSPDRPLERRDKNVTSIPLEWIRLFLYLADALSLSLRVRRLQRAHGLHVVIFDRYIYDELANLSLHRPVTRFAARLILKMAPVPDLACIVDVAPDLARARKPEYPLEFLHRNRQAYLGLSDIAKNLRVVANGSVEETAMKIRAELPLRLARESGPMPDFSTAMLP